MYTPTIIFCWAVIAAVAAWDIYVAFFNDIPNSKDTISGLGLWLARTKRVWALPYLFGILGGHVWLTGSWLLKPWLSGILMLASVAMVWVLGKKLRTTQTNWIRLSLILAGLAVGHYLVPMAS